ncbi:CDP-alcohol phosphatidyltransferase [Terrabacter sp. BE26]|uniref:CDP-alcohol phosphatidyltransferase n=1 Tax=Terrabacter sp. BE26 TaxID=2898152 RepID=UPI0035BE7FA3
MALVAPDSGAPTGPVALLRVPVEGLVLGALVLALPAAGSRWVRRWVLPPVGVLLGVLLLVRILDRVFREVFFYRPFNLTSDWRYAASGVQLVRDASGPAVAALAAVAAGLVVGGVLVLLPLSLRRLAAVADRHRSASRPVLAALAAVWVVAAVTGSAAAPGLPVAASSTVALADEQARKALDDVRDHAVFASAIGADGFAHAAPSALVPALDGKDVVVVFVESYGKVALGSPGVQQAVHEGRTSLVAQGYSMRSAWLSSPTFGGFSWLAHSSLQTGLWVDSQQRYDQLVTTDRLTLSRVFSTAGWRTVAVVPANQHDWPEGRDFYGYDQVWDARTLGYRGPGFGYAPMPDQYTLSAFDRLELQASPRRAVMAEVDLVTSHIPWAPLPRLVDWSTLGDGTAFVPQVARATPQSEVWRTPEGVHAAYAQSIAYSIDSIVAWLSHTRDDHLVVLVLGDHQPATVVSGVGASHEVPVTVLTRDALVTGRIAGWRWQDGLAPRADAPVWPMSAVRDRILTSFR